MSKSGLGVTADTTPQLLVVSGPTACGKSSFAIKLAKELNGEIINIDSVQVYQKLNIGAAKLSNEDMQGVPHHLIDIFPPEENCNVAEYCRRAKESIQEIHSRGKAVILAGGTTMYITCLLQGLEKLPDSDKGLRAELEALSTEELVDRINEIDPTSLERISRTDRVRLVRALETSILGGVPASMARDKHAGTQADYNALILLLCWERDFLYNRINKRVKQMLEHGLIDETRKLIELFGENIPGLKSLGYAQVSEYLRGEIDASELEDKISMLTRRFAKRQMTYWRNEPNKKGWVIKPGMDDNFVELEDSFKTLDLAPDMLITKIKDRLSKLVGNTEVWFLNMHNYSK